MKTLRLKMAPVWLLSLVLIMGGMWWSATSVADNLPSSPAPGAFSPWMKMHPSTFTLSVDAVWEQCERTRPTETWLTPKHCTLLTEKLEAKQCKVVWVPDGVRFDRLLGRVNGRKGPSKAWAKQEKRTGRLDRALLCDLGAGVYSYWFTGQRNKSCNNVAFVYLPPAKPAVVTPPPAPVVPPVVKKPEPIVEPLPTPLPPPPPSGKWVCVLVPVGEALQSPVGHHHEGFVLRNECCCDENPLVVRSHNFHLGSTVQSAGYAEQCFFQPN